MSQTKAQLIDGLDIDPSAPDGSVNIDSSGRLGLGTSSPGSKLEVFSTGTFGTAYQPSIFITNSSSGGSTLANTGLGAIVWATDSNATTVSSIEAIRENPNAGAASALVLRTGSSGGGTERVRVTSGGLVGIGTTSPTFLLELPNVASNAGGRGRSNQWATYSDGRIKTDREELPYGIDAVMQLEPLRYFHHNSTINEDGTIEILEEGEVSIGLVAQDVDNIIPEVVSVPEDLTKDLCSLDYAKLNAVLVKAIQEQQAMIAELQTKVAALEAS
jgi:hypothetical protein